MHPALIDGITLNGQIYMDLNFKMVIKDVKGQLVSMNELLNKRIASSNYLINKILQLLLFQNRAIDEINSDNGQV